jgi:hypothetical protein
MAGLRQWAQEGEAVPASELIGKRRDFVISYTGLLGTGLSVLGENSRLSQEEIQILKTFLVEGYDSLLKKYKKTKAISASMWMKKQCGSTEPGPA